MNFKFSTKFSKNQYHIVKVYIPCEAKKLHRIIFAIALSELHLLG